MRQPPASGTPADPERTSTLEAILDSLTGWAVVALVIGLLYLVWATVEILGRYMGDLPAVGP